MAGTAGVGSRSAALAISSVDSFLEAKLNRPPTRSDWVDRVRLLDRLDQATHHRVALVAAPTGFGKTTLVAQWLATSRPPAAAWVSLDAGDNDPGRLWTHVAAALARTGCPLGSEIGRFVATHSAAVIADVLPRLLNAMAEMEDGIVLVLDDFHCVRNSACHEQVDFLVQHLTPRAHLLIATRADPALRLGRLRAAGGLDEIRAADLAFNASEVSTMLDAQRVRLSQASERQLLSRTEGWPAGLYLATLSLSGRADPDDFVRQFSGGNRFIGDYLTEEVLNGLPRPVRDFITSISLLDRFCAPLCDALAKRTGSASLLNDLARTNMFLIPLDDDRKWFRFHHLFAAVARSVLELEHPNRIPGLHGRAATWFREQGHVDEAVRHSLASGNPRDAAVLVQANWVKYVDAGRAATVLGWLDALGAPSIATDPAAGVTAAWMAALVGDEDKLGHMLEALQEFRDYGPLPDGTRSVESAISMIQGQFGYGGPAEMTAGARRAVELETDGRSPYFAIANFTLGHAAYVSADLDLAANLLAKASQSEVAPAIIQVLSLSVYSLVEAERGNQDRARELAEQAMAVVEARGLRALPQSSMAFTALGQAQAEAGELSDAMTTVQIGLDLRRSNPALSPWATLHHVLVAARVTVEVGDLPTARHLLREAAERIDRFTDGMGPMRARLAAVHHLLRGRLVETKAGEPLTGRELEVLRLLEGSMSLTEIAGKLYVSPNTVKTHTKALYRKLGAGSRTEAVRIARQRLLV